jgi:hypothetical protein
VIGVTDHQIGLAAHEGANYTGEARTVRRHERSLASAAQPSVLLFASTQADAGQGVPASQRKAEVDCAGWPYRKRRINSWSAILPRSN